MRILVRIPGVFSGSPWQNGFRGNVRILTSTKEVSMKNAFFAFLLCFTVFAAQTQRSHAAIGAALSAPAAIVVGGVIAAAGAGSTAVCLGFNACIGGDGGTLDSLMLLIYIPVAAVGLLVLDGEQAGEISFTAVPSAQGFSADEVAAYNAELDELNAIAQTISAQAAADLHVDAKALWEQYAADLSASTVKIAALHAQQLITQQ